MACSLFFLLKVCTMWGLAYRLLHSFFFACLEIPFLNPKSVKEREGEIATAFTTVAQQSCSTQLQEEQKLTEATLTGYVYLIDKHEQLWKINLK